VSATPLLDALVRRRYLVLGALAALVYATSVVRLSGLSDWQFFVFGGDLLLGHHHTLVLEGEQIPASFPGGVHLYANYRFLQIGPPPLLLAVVIDRLGGATLAAAVIQALGLVAIFAVERAFPRAADTYSKILALVGGAQVTVAWASITQVHHLDDAIALAAVAAAFYALRHDRYVWAGLLIGLASASKPWAVVALALALIPTSRRAQLAVLASALAVCAAFWLPFIAGDAGTLQLGHVRLVEQPDSALAALHTNLVHSSQDLRLLQLGLGLALALLLTARRRPELAILAAFAARLVLEPSTYRYYGAALMVAAFIADAGRPHGRRLPILTLTAVAIWLLGDLVSPDQTAAQLRLVVYAGLAVYCLGVPARSSVPKPT
jgi:hypothetical protein